MALDWQEYPGDQIQAPLSVADNYVISHRHEEHTVCYRPPGEHHYVGAFKTPEEARSAAEKHNARRLIVENGRHHA